MGVNIDIDQNVLSLNPVFVFSPTARNGITLIQRLLNSSRQVIVFGEDRLFVEAMTEMLASKIHDCNVHGKDKSLDREKFLTQTTEFWTSALSPDDSQYLQILVDNFCRVILFLQKWSEDQGFENWGLKYPLSNLLPLDVFLRFMANARCIYIYRNLFDVARSSKARKWLNTTNDLIVLAQRWQDNLLPLLLNPRDRVMMLKYEDLVSDPEMHIRKIEEFAGISGIDRNVMKRKINTFKGDAKDGRSPTNYIEPEKLTGEETSLLQMHAAKGLEKTGYRDNV